MALGKYAGDYEMRVDYDRLRKERLQRAKIGSEKTVWGPSSPGMRRTFGT